MIVFGQQRLRRSNNATEALCALEGFLDRLIRSAHADDFVLKGGVLLVAYTERRPTRDIDFALPQAEASLEGIRGLTKNILSIEVDDATEVEQIRDDEVFPSIRAKDTGSLSTAQIRIHIDINVGDPLWPEPKQIELSRLLGSHPLQIPGYAVLLVLAPEGAMILQRVGHRWSLRRTPTAPGQVTGSRLMVIGLRGAIDDAWLADRLGR